MSKTWDHWFKILTTLWTEIESVLLFSQLGYWLKVFTYHCALHITLSCYHNILQNYWTAFTDNLFLTMITYPVKHAFGAVSEQGEIEELHFWCSGCIKNTFLSLPCFSLWSYFFFHFYFHFYFLFFFSGCWHIKTFFQTLTLHSAFTEGYLWWQKHRGSLKNSKKICISFNLFHIWQIGCL